MGKEYSRQRNTSFDRFQDLINSEGHLRQEDEKTTLTEHTHISHTEIIHIPKQWFVIFSGVFVFFY